MNKQSLYKINKGIFFFKRCKKKFFLKKWNIKYMFINVKIIIYFKNKIKNLKDKILKNQKLILD